MNALTRPDAPTLPVPPTSAQGGVLARSGRTIIHAAVIAVLANVIGPGLNQRPLGQRINEYINAGSYLPFSVGLAAGLNNDRLTMIGLAVFLVINNYPESLVLMATAAITGLALGAGLRQLLLENK